jgi:hypothetical protein
LKIIEMGDAVGHHCRSGAGKERLREDLGVLCLYLMVVLVEGAGVDRSVGASKLLQGDTGYSGTQTG